MPFGIGTSSSVNAPVAVQQSVGDSSAPILSGRITGGVRITEVDAGIVQAARDALASAAEALLGTATIAQTGVSEAARINADVTINAQGVVADIAAGSQRISEDVIGRAIDLVTGAGSYGDVINARALDTAEAMGARAFAFGGEALQANAAFGSEALQANTGLIATFGQFARDLADKVIVASDNNSARTAALVGSQPLPAPLVATSGPDYGKLALIALGVIVVGVGAYKVARA